MKIKAIEFLFLAVFGFNAYAKLSKICPSFEMYKKSISKIIGKKDPLKMRIKDFASVNMKEFIRKNNTNFQACGDVISKWSESCHNFKISNSKKDFNKCINTKEAGYVRLLTTFILMQEQIKDSKKKNKIGKLQGFPILTFSPSYQVFTLENTMIIHFSVSVAEQFLTKLAKSFLEVGKSLEKMEKNLEKSEIKKAKVTKRIRQTKRRKRR